MLKSEAIEILGGAPTAAVAAAELMGVTYQAVQKWPAHLPRRISDRVLGVCVRRGINVPDRFLECHGTASDSEPKHPAALAHQAQGATETVAEVA